MAGRTDVRAVVQGRTREVVAWQLGGQSLVELSNTNLFKAGGRNDVNSNSRVESRAIGHTGTDGHDSVERTVVFVRGFLSLRSKAGCSK